MSETPEFQVAMAPYLVAVGDSARLVVYRSEHVDKHAPAYQQIADYIIDHRMVLISTETTTHTDMVGHVEVTHWGTPEGRMQWLAYQQANTPEENNE